MKFNIQRSSSNRNNFGEKNIDIQHTRKFKEMFKKIGRFAVQTGKTLAPIVPGGEVIKIALDGLNNISKNQNIQHGGFNPYDMLHIQHEMLNEARMFTLLSNIIKVRHDTVMNSIRNIR